MAEAVGYWIAETVSSYVGLAIAGNAAVINAALVIGANVAYSGYQARAAAARARASYNASLKDNQIMIRSAIAPRPVIYGRAKISGPLAYWESTGKKDEYLHLVIALAGHECDAIEKVYFNEDELPITESQGVDSYFDVTTGDYTAFKTRDAREILPSGDSITLAHTPSKITSVTIPDPGDGDGSLLASWTWTPGTNVVTFPAGINKYTIDYEWEEAQPLVRIRKHLGQSGQVADADLIAASDGKWTSDMVGVGICYLYVRLKFDQDVFGQIGIPNISVIARGKKVRDPRTGITAWSATAALCVADYLRDSLHGLGATAGQVPDAEIIAAANICDENVTLTVGGATQKRYTTNGSISTEDSPRDNLALLLSTMAGTAVWVQGRWLVRAGAYVAPSMTITEDYLAGDQIEIVPRPARRDTFNRVTGTFVDPAQAWAEVQYPRVANSLYEAEDGGQVLTRQMTMQLVDDSKRAQRLAKIALERARQSVTIRLGANLRAYDLVPSDTVRLTLARYGWVNKVFEVRERTYTPGGVLSYTMTETAAGVWAWNYGEATDVDLADNTRLPSPFAKPRALTNLQAESGTEHLQRLSDGSIITRVQLTWDETEDVFVERGGRIEIQYKASSAKRWQSAPPVPGDELDALIGPLIDKQVTLIRVRPVNALGRIGPWTTITHKVVGKTERPSTVGPVTYVIEASGIRLTWPAVPDLDVRNYQVRTGGTSWDDAEIVARQVGGTSYLWKMQLTASTVVRVKAVDTSGNSSAASSDVEILLAKPGKVTALRAEIIDNYVLLYWSAPTGGSLPLESYQVRKGQTWAASVAVGDNALSTFAVLFEQSGGQYRYWVAAVDKAGNVGTPAPVDATLYEPADYVLRLNIDSVFSGTKSGMYLDDGMLCGPSLGQTWTQHFQSRGWTTPQDQVNAGYPLYYQPSAGFGSYQEEVDYGAVLPSSTISVSLSQAFVDNVAVTCQIDFRETSASAWIAAPAGNTRALASNFRYVRITLTFAATGDKALIKCSGLNIKLGAKRRTDSGKASISNAEAGVWVPFSVAYIDADAPIVQPIGSTKLKEIVEFTDDPFPSGFHVYLYYTEGAQAGQRATGSFSWQCNGFT